MARRDDDGRPGAQDRERAAARARIQHQETWVDLQLRRAMERGDFDDLPGMGKPLPGLGEEHDPDWWVKRLVERERITVLPPALQLQRDDAHLEAVLDRLGSEAEVRREVGEFNERVRRTLYTTTGWPPVVTQPRDLETEVERWRQRLAERRSAAREAQQAQSRPAPSTATRRRRRWWRRRPAADD